MKLDDVVYIVVNGRRYKGKVQVVHRSLDDGGIIKTIGVLVAELDERRPYMRPLDQVFRTSRDAKAAIEQAGA